MKREKIRLLLNNLVKDSQKAKTFYNKITFIEK